MTSVESKHEVVLFQWLGEVSHEFSLSYCTFFHAYSAYHKLKVLLGDQLNIDNLQTMGVACLYYASLQCERHPPLAVHCVMMTDGATTSQQFQTALTHIFLNVGLVSDENPWFHIVRLTEDPDQRRHLAEAVTQSILKGTHPHLDTTQKDPPPSPPLTQKYQRLGWSASTLHGMITKG
jgi:hypothetical protein